MPVLAILLDPASFPVGGPSAGSVSDELEAVGIETTLVQFGDQWWEVLASERRSVPVNDYAYAHA
jgi:hypothetical protein